MTNEKIKEQAAKFANQILVENVVYHRNFSMSDTAKAFTEGAKWRINSIWHDWGETPENGRAVLCEIDNHEETFNDYVTSDSGLPHERYSDIIRWAYVDELLPL